MAEWWNVWRVEKMNMRWLRQLGVAILVVDNENKKKCENYRTWHGGYWGEKGRLQNYTFSALNSLQKSFTSTICDGDDDDWKIELRNFCSTAGICARPIRASVPLGLFSLTLRLSENIRIRPGMGWKWDRNFFFEIWLSIKADFK